MRQHSNLILALLLFGSSGLAAEALDYPELQVRPLASERLTMEAQAEKAQRWLRFAPFQISGLTTMVAANIASSDKPKESDTASSDQMTATANAAYVVGGATLIGSTLVGMFYKPYTSGWARMTRQAVKSSSDSLIRERLAEEALAAPANLARRLTYLSALLNAGVSVALMDKTEQTGKIASSVAAATALLPLLFQDAYIGTWTQHREYKKKIYAPLPAASVLRSRGRLISGLSWEYRF